MRHFKSLQLLTPFKKIRKSNNLSERDFCQKHSISRVSLRHIENFQGNITLQSLDTYTKALEVEVGIYAAKENGASEFSTIAVCLKVERDGFETWKLHFMDFVDEFRRSLDSRLLVLAPPKNFPLRLTALLASIVLDISNEAQISPPHWALKSYALKEPWFLAGADSLKAMALVESSAYYKKNNIFVLDNFLKRA